MAKIQKSNKEVRKPKADKPKLKKDAGGSGEGLLGATKGSSKPPKK